MNEPYPDNETLLKPPRPESFAAVRLLQGVVYSSDQRPWEQVLSYRSNLEDYFSRIGLVLVVDEADGLAYLRQYSDDERSATGDALPRLFRRMPLTYSDNHYFLGILWRMPSSARWTVLRRA